MTAQQPSSLIKLSNPIKLSNHVHVRRPYFFELFTLVNFAAIAIWMAPSLPPQRWLVALIFLPVYLGLAIVGVLVRYVVARTRGRSHSLLRVFRSRRWLTDSVRLVVFSTWTTFTYGCIKLLVPIGHPRLFDRELWNLDARLFFGMSPNVFFVSLFGNPFVLKAIDWTYANAFLASLWIASMYFLSSPARRTRIAFMNSNCLLWLLGAWLYMLVPSLGPAYRFPDVWLPLAHSLERTQTLQRLLMTNYQAVLHGAPANILYGIAAFPSLHVGFVSLAFFWMRKLERWGSLLFGVFLVLIFVGSVVTGWHYLIDSLAGLALAWICYAAASRLSGSRRTPRETRA